MRLLNYALILFVAISCHETNSEVDTVLMNFVRAKKNDSDWRGATEIHLNKNADTLVFLGISHSPDSEVIVMKFKFSGVGKYTLSDSQASYYSTIGGDVTLSEYELRANEKGKIEISNYHEKEKLIEGKFEMTLKKQRCNPDTCEEFIIFTEGYFKGPAIR
jgi:uncharacterized protein YdgA (DUF945 family)